ncbi:carbon storage regulator [Tautonia sp. JC769]|uniref:carbon storage regulator n=1 Tax=Tautonia sp. JC769 TaxID=3232135 RepID=UPI003457A061
MLVLTRKRMEKLYIGRDICVTVVRLEGGQVRLGIDAPRHVPVVRAELRQRDEAEAALARLGGEMVTVEDPTAIPTTAAANDCWTRIEPPLGHRLRAESGPSGTQA